MVHGQILGAEMRGRYQVRWYAYNLTEPMSRDFFTEFGATMFHLWRWYVRGEESIIYERTRK